MRSLLSAAAIICLWSLAASAQFLNGGYSSGQAWSGPNEGSTGTSYYTLTKTTGSPQSAIKAATTDTFGIIGITVAGAGTTGSAVVQEIGIVPCQFDGSTTAGHYVQISSTTAGDCHDTGASTYPTTLGQVIGKVQTTHSGSGLVSVNLFAPDTISATGSGNGVPGGAQGTQQYNLNGTTTFGGSSVLDACAFSGATADVQINAAMAALPSGGGTLDLTCYGATNQTIAAQVTLGSCTTKPTVNVIVDPATVFTCTIAGGGAGTCWLLNSGVNMWASRNTGAYTHVTNQGFTGSSAANVATIMQVGNSASCAGGTLFTSVQGINFVQETTSPTVTKAVLWVDSPSNAASVENITIFGWNQPNAVGLLVDNNNGFGPITLKNNEVDSGYQSCTPLKIAQASTTGFAGITVENGEYQHPGTGAGCGQSIWLQSFSSCSVALSPILLNGVHVESGNLADADILIDGANDVTSIGTWATAGNNGAATDLFKIQNRAGGCAADHIDLLSTTNWNSGVSGNVIHDVTGNYSSGAINHVGIYQLANSGIGNVTNGRPVQVVARTLASFGACNALAEGSMITQTDSNAACSAGTTATSGGTTHCQDYCNGTNYVNTGR